MTVADLAKLLDVNLLTLSSILHKQAAEYQRLT
jgi:hypothetical protein